MIEAGMFQAVELPLVLLGGLLGSSHCIGMCGGFAVAIGYGADRVLSNVARQVTWSSGRVFTYTFGGAVAGFAGAQAGNRFSFTSMQGVLALLAGVLLIVQGLLSAGVLPRRRKVPGKCSAVSQLAWLLPIGRMLLPGRDRSSARATRLAEAFLAGVITGFLPCGLVYAYLALAAASGSLWYGAAIMTVFGLGTMPIMVLTGTGMSLVPLRTRTRVFRLAAWCVFATGLLTVSRGVAAFERPAAAQSGIECPLCDPSDTPVAADGTGQSQSVSEP